MFLSELTLINFKNYTQREFVLLPGINCFVGANGSGKTNVLDAVHYLSSCRSYLNSIDRQNIRFGEQFFVLEGRFKGGDTEDAIYCAVKAGSKKIFKRNKSEYEKLADHIGRYPSVMISPYDNDLIAEGSEVRRKWLDSIISQFDRSYLQALMRYAKVLEQRNALLKNFSERGFFEAETIEIWDEQLIELGKSIHAVRTEFLDRLIPVFQKYYQFIGMDSEQVAISYKSQLNEGDFRELLLQARRKDTFAQYTTVGTHKDDLVFTIKGYPVKKFGSQGQQKSFLLALRLAQFECLKENLKITPILLLDDIFDKLDQHRVQRLMSLVSDQHFGQVLVTDTDADRINKIFSEINVPYSMVDVSEEIEKVVQYG